MFFLKLDSARLLQSPSPYDFSLHRSTSTHLDRPWVPYPRGVTGEVSEIQTNLHNHMGKRVVIAWFCSSPGPPGQALGPGTSCRFVPSAGPLGFRGSLRGSRGIDLSGPGEEGEGRGCESRGRALAKVRLEGVSGPSDRCADRGLGVPDSGPKPVKANNNFYPTRS